MQVGDLVKERAKGKGWALRTEPKIGIVTYVSLWQTNGVHRITFICTDGISMTRESSHLEVVCK